MFYLRQYRMALGEDGERELKIPFDFDCPKVCGECKTIHIGDCDPERKASMDEFYKLIDFIG